MPVMPAFFRHISSQKTQSRALRTSSEGVVKKLTNGVFGYQGSPKLSSEPPEDPYLSQREYEELGDLEGQKSNEILQDEANRTTGMVEG